MSDEPTVDTVNQKPTFTTTPETNLFLGFEATKQRITQLKDFVTNIPEAERLRNVWLQESRYPLVNTDENGKKFVILYRAKPSTWEDATVAAGYANRTNNEIDISSSKTGISQMDAYSQDITVDGGTKFIKELVNQDFVDSKHSLLVPATCDPYCAFGYTEDGRSDLLVLKVPWEQIIPVQTACEQYNLSKFDEDEVAVAGEITPDMIVKKYRPAEIKAWGGIGPEETRSRMRTIEYSDKSFGNGIDNAIKSEPVRKLLEGCNQFEQIAILRKLAEKYNIKGFKIFKSEDLTVKSEP